MQERMNWIGGIAAANQLADKGNRLSTGRSRIVQGGKPVTAGPYTDGKDFVTGYMIVRTGSIEEAVELAKRNPILKGGGSVEVRAVLAAEEKD